MDTGQDTRDGTRQMCFAVPAAGQDDKTDPSRKQKTALGKPRTRHQAKTGYVDRTTLGERKACEANAYGACANAQGKRKEARNKLLQTVRGMYRLLDVENEIFHML